MMRWMESIWRRFGTGFPRSAIRKRAILLALLNRACAVSLLPTTVTPMILIYLARRTENFFGNGYFRELGREIQLPRTFTSKADR